MQAARGLTLVELMIAISILALLLAVAAPDMRSLVDRQRGESALSALAVAVQGARTSAIRTGLTVTVCRSMDGLRCGGSWSQGYIVFSDRNRDRRLNQDDALLRTGRFLELGGTLAWRAFGNRQYLQIDSRGHILHQNGNFTFCPGSGQLAQARQLVISQTGRIRLAIDADGDGMVEDSSGKPLRCE
jgi:type IV fimbrial biogenesis protein FimT